MSVIIILLSIVVFSSIVINILIGIPYVSITYLLDHCENSADIVISEKSKLLSFLSLIYIIYYVFQIGIATIQKIESQNENIQVLLTLAYKKNFLHCSNIQMYLGVSQTIFDNVINSISHGVGLRGPPLSAFLRWIRSRDSQDPQFF